MRPGHLRRVLLAALHRPAALPATQVAPTVNAEESNVASIPARRGASAGPEAARGSTLLTNHALVLVSIANNPDIRVRDIAEMVGITERTTQAILNDLERSGYIERTHIGRRTRYSIHWNAPLPHPLARSTTVGDLLTALSPSARMVSATTAD
jgi:Winged helix-turn-helix DNA-binding